MNNLQRLSRKERQRLTANKKAPVALGLAVLLLFLILGNTYRDRIERLFRSDDPGEIQKLAYTIAVQTGESFHLSDSSYTDSLLAQPGDPESDNIIRRIRQPWPNHLPFEFYVERLRRLSRDNGLTCDCIESGREGRLLCTIGSGSLTGAQVVLETQSGTKLFDREIAFLFRNLGALSNKKIMEILDHDFAFSYVASPDVYPSSRMKKTLEKAGITSIIELPADISNLAEFGSSDDKPASKKTQNRDGASIQELVKMIFGRHPNPGAVSFEKSDHPDTAFVRSAIELAREMKIAYLYENTIPDRIDSLAYSAGLTMISMKNVADFRGNSIVEIRPVILQDLISSQISARKIALFDAASMDVAELVDLQESLRELGVNIMDCISLADIEESL